MTRNLPDRPTTRRAVALTGAAWLSMLGFDVLLHGGILSGFYVTADPFLLDPSEAFRRIPIGYASFLLLAILLVWLAIRTGVRGIGTGVRFGLILGAFLWGASVLGLWSITTARPTLLVGWLVGQTIEMGIAGGVAGAGLAGAPLPRLYGFAVALAVVCFAITVALQSFGLAPVVRAG